jgi:predicted HNH restriction endonuclease
MRIISPRYGSVFITVCAQAIYQKQWQLVFSIFDIKHDEASVEGNTVQAFWAQYECNMTAVQNTIFDIAVRCCHKLCLTGTENSQCF